MVPLPGSCCGRVKVDEPVAERAKDKAECRLERGQDDSPDGHDLENVQGAVRGRKKGRDQSQSDLRQRREQRDRPEMVPDEMGRSAQP